MDTVDNDVPEPVLPQLAWFALRAQLLSQWTAEQLLQEQHTNSLADPLGTKHTPAAVKTTCCAGSLFQTEI